MSHTPTKSAADSLYGLGYWLLDQRRYDDAVHVFRTMLLIAPSDDRAWLALGMTHEGRDEVGQAARLYDLGRKACGRSLRCVLALGRALRRLGRDDEASEVYAEALEMAAHGEDPELGALVAIEAAS